MNYFAHALPFLDDPYFMAGTAIPDWLSVVDRGVRLRAKHAEQFVDDADSDTASVARGVLQHLRDDAVFHESRAFAELSLDLTVRARDALGGEPGLRPAFLGHLLVEVLLDAVLIAELPQRLERYYRAMDSVDGRLVQAIINRMAPRATDRLAPMISEFCGERILSDYAEGARLFVRLGQVMRRVKLAQLPEGFVETLPDLRRRVRRRRNELLDGIPT